MMARQLAKTTEPIELSLQLPDGYQPLAVLPLAEFAAVAPRDEAFVLASTDIDWAHWEDFSRIHAALDDAVFERDANHREVWTVDELGHPAHARWLRTRLPGAVLAGRSEDGALYRLIATPVDDGETSADEELAHWSSKLGGEPSFSQAAMRARSRTRGELWPFLGQLRGDVIHDVYGYTFYLWGDVSRGELAVSCQR